MIQPLLWIMASLIYTFIGLVGTYLIVVVDRNPERFSFSAILIALFFFAILFMYYGIRYRNLFFSGKHSTVANETVSYMEMRPLSKGDILFLPDLLLKVRFRMRTVKYYRVFYRIEGDNTLKQCSAILTMHQLDLLSKFDHPDTFYPGISYWHKSLLFDHVPVKICYGEKNRMLRKIDLADGYDYTSAQENLLDRFNSSVAEYKVPWVLFPLMAFAYALVLSLICVSSFLLIKELPVTYEKIIPLFFAMIFVSLFYCATFSDGYAAKGTGRKGPFCSQNVLLKESRPLRLENGSRRYLRWIFPDEEPIYQRAGFHPDYYGMKHLKPQPQNKFYWVLTKEKVDALNALYDCRLSYVCSYERMGGHSLIRTEFSFDGDLVLKVTYAKIGKELISIAPAEGYEYTEAQLAAIEKFNTLYP